MLCIYKISPCSACAWYTKSCCYIYIYILYDYNYNIHTINNNTISLIIAQWLYVYIYKTLNCMWAHIIKRSYLVMRSVSFRCKHIDVILLIDCYLCCITHSRAADTTMGVNEPRSTSQICCDPYPCQWDGVRGLGLFLAQHVHKPESD